MKITVISDTHGLHSLLRKLPEADTIIHCGDFSNIGEKEQVLEFIEWFGSLSYKSRILIAGNHDRIMDPKFHRSPDDAKWLRDTRDLMEASGVTYLENSGVEIDGIRFWGSPITPDFYPQNWAFNRPRGVEINRVWKTIPIRTDIVITHGPPQYRLDRTAKGDYAGCADLAYQVEMIKPQYHLFGHIHEGYGIEEWGDTTYVNASTLNQYYDVRNKPLVFDI